jgi:hypothetical protein
MSPVDMRQEAAIHGAYNANNIPAPRVLGVIDDPYSIVLERIRGWDKCYASRQINTGQPPK